MSDFKKMRTEMQKHLKKMFKNDNLFVTHTDRETIWNTYLDNFPEGSNDIFRERREHDCNCCKSFIRQFGNVVAIENGEIITVWDFNAKNNTYQQVVDALAEYVKNSGIRDYFVTKEPSFGTESNMDTESQIKWYHFHASVPAKFRITGHKSVGSVMGEMRDIRNVFHRSLTEISISAVETVLDLIYQGSLYKGDEWTHALEQFQKLKKDFGTLTMFERNLFTWATAPRIGPVIGKIRNHSIGTLLIDITDGEKTLDQAVKSYENIVAPHNYKRPKPIYTKNQLKKMKEKFAELGLLPSLSRRHAVLDDINVNDIIFINREEVNTTEDGDLFAQMENGAKKNNKSFKNVPEMDIEDFIKKVLPSAQSLEAMIEPRHRQNFVSVIAPDDITAPSMFKWSNSFSWSYNGNLTDSSIKNAVKNAGGDVTGALRFSIYWNDVENGDRNPNDYDAHAVQPDSKHIYYSSKGESLYSGRLDVDITRPEDNVAAVENITWATADLVKPGDYHFYVHNFSHRGGSSGFRAEIEYKGQIWQFAYPYDLKENEKVTVAKINIGVDKKLTFKKSLEYTSHNFNIWGIDTGDFVPVSVCMYSPNHWGDNKVGHKHYMFMLKDCRNPDNVRGFYNEYLKTELVTDHKKALEALGSMAIVQNTDNQLSGLGFSSTRRNSVLFRVGGSFNRVIKVNF